MNHKDQIVLSPDARRAIALVQMEMVKKANLDIKIIFPALKMKMPKTRTSKNAHFTRKGSGRYHPNVAEMTARANREMLARAKEKEAVAV